MLMLCYYKIYNSHFFTIC